MFKTYKSFAIYLSKREISEEMKEYFSQIKPALREMFRRGYTLRKGDIFSTIFEIISPDERVFPLPSNPHEFEKFLTPHCPRCGAEMFHEVGHIGGIRHFCPVCGYEQWGRITDGTCRECAELE